MNMELIQMLFLHELIPSCVFSSVDGQPAVLHLVIFAYRTGLASGDKLCLAATDLYICHQIPFTSIFVRILGSVFIRDIGLPSSCAVFVWFLLSE